MEINVIKLDHELKAAGIPIHGVSSDGRIDFKDEATKAQRSKAAQILAAHDPVDVAAERQASYREAFTLDDFLEAFFEAEFELRPEKLAELQRRREAIKAEHQG